jgi:hypothetical protein
MSSFKISKKEVLTDPRVTVEELHNQKINQIENDKKNINLFIRELEDLKLIQNRNFTQDSRISELENKIQRIQSGEEETEYYLNFFPILKNIFDSKDKEKQKLVSDPTKKGNIDNFVESKVDNSKETIYNQYVREFRPDLELYVKKESADETPCSVCGLIDYIEDSKEGSIVCLNCGKSESFYNNTPEGLTYNQGEIEQVTQFSYKRINHFQECLSQFQAKESTEIPEIIIDSLLEELRKHQITDPTLITPRLIKSYLKKLKYNKYYEHIPFIINELCGLPPPKIDQRLEEQLKIMFDEIQKPFEKYRPKDRKNFLSYNFILYKMCQLLGKDHLLICFPLLKSREKLYQQDCIWKNICEDLQWEFIPSL